MAAASIGFVSPSIHARVWVSRSGLGFLSVGCCSSSAVEDHVGGTSSSSLRHRIKPRLVGMGSKLVGCGSAVPKHQFSNDDLARIVETSDEWISVRTGIHNRRVLTGNETLNGLSVDAAKEALQMAEVEAENVDLVILCSSTPDDLFGGAARVDSSHPDNPPCFSSRLV